MLDGMETTELTENEYSFLREAMMASGAALYCGEYEGSTVLLETNTDVFYLVETDGFHSLSSEKIE